MENSNGITYRKPSGLSCQGLRNWGLLFLLCGAVGYGIFQQKLLPAYGDTASLGILSIALVLQIVQMCAVPIFTFLAVQGAIHTVSLRMYILRVALLAIATELPYNLCMNGNAFSFLRFGGGFHLLSGLNPVFGVLLCLVILGFFKMYSQPGFKNFAIKTFLWLMAFVWSNFLQIAYAPMMLMLLPVLWFFREKKMMQVFMGSGAVLLSSVFYLGGSGSLMMGCMIAPLVFTAIHFYNGEPGNGNKIINYLAYPAILLAVWLIAVLAF